MSKSFLSGVALVCVLALAPAGAVQAEETGVAGIHTWVKVGRKTCLADHFHDGTGAGRTRAKAQAEAIQAWTDFTAWEYGGTWGRYSLAVGKSMSCSQSGGSWTCNTQARACRPF
jgi:hypothetical protein